MEELKFLNVKEFSYRISINSDISNIYDEKIESLRSKIINIKEEIYLMEQLISLSDEEIKKSKSKDDYNTLASDKEYFKKTLSNYRMLINAYGTALNQVFLKKNKLNELLSDIKYYNGNLDSINKTIKQYNYDIIYEEKNIEDINKISDFKNKLYSIVFYDYKDINVNIDTNKLKKEYNKLLDIENYYKTDLKKNNKLKTDEDYKEVDTNDFIFMSSIKDDKKALIDYDISENNDYSDFICFNDYKSNKKKNHKITKIRKASKWGKIKKSLKKNIGKVIAGLLAGITMIGISTITAGYDKKISDNINSKSISTIDSVNEDVKVNIEKNIIEDITSNSVDNEIEYAQPSNSFNSNIDAEIDEKEDNKEITIGTKVSATNDIYINATDAYNKENSMTTYYPISDEREVSLIYYKNSEGDTELISNDNKEKIAELKKLKYDVIAYCLDNVTQNIGEGWYNVDDVKVLVK